MSRPVSLEADVGKILWAVSAALFCCLCGLWALRAFINLPPGPWGLPVVGYLPWLNPRTPHLTMVRLVERYGRLFSLRMGGVLVVVMADPHTIREVLAQRSTTGRAPLFLTHGIMKGYGLICSEGDLWREHRKFVLGFMRDHGMRTTATRAAMEPQIHAVATHLTQELAESRGTPVDISHHLLHHVGNTMNHLIFGITYREEDPKWRWLRLLLEEGTKLVGVSGPLNFLPWLRFLPTYRSVIKFITENQSKTHQEYQSIITDHEKRISSGVSVESPPDAPEAERGAPEVALSRTQEKEEEPCQEVPDGDEASGARLAEDQSGEMVSSSKVPLHIVDAYVRERRERGEEEPGSFTYEQLHHVAADLFGAGSETTITTFKWHLLNMALFPEAQERVQKELQECQPAGGAEVTMEDAHLLPYTQASILETQRLRSILPLGIPHGTTQELTIDGYRIPKGTMLLPLLWQVHHDPDTWSNPDQYRPERFLDQEGQVIRHPAFMPFQTGRRMCIGDEFAKMILFVFTTKILLRFKVDLEPGVKDDPSKDPVCGISLCPRPFKLVFTPRVSQADEN
ncbi:cytochrome P450 306a1 [Procambarus clarkii]|uniref:cytochrome P450 306a1 n=1 Tax=Procambarus clarkii TaxID=6728 RepID=UPI0037447018